MNQRALGRLLAPSVALACLSACASPPVRPSPTTTGPQQPSSSLSPSPSPSTPNPTPTSPSHPASASAPPPTSVPVVLVTDPAVLSTLEARGLTLAHFLGTADGARDNAALAQTPAYASIADALSREVADHAARDPKAGVGVARFSHRLFDVRWLRSDKTRYELVGVVNRFDRQPFHAGSCGETRLVYRLAYTSQRGETTLASRLPMTIGVELAVPRGADGCTAVARRWAPPKSLAGRALAEHLTGAAGPLEASVLESSRRFSHRIVVNMQTVRWPSAVRPDLGGHAEYALVAFRRDAATERYTLAPLENTPDVERARRSPAFRQQLLEHLRSEETLRALDAGTLVLPESLLARRAVSVTPRGLSRGQNRPFSSLFTAADLGTLDFAPHRRVRSAEGALRRLDSLSCQGCHEARSIAGFHLLGDDPASEPLGNALDGGSSPHVIAELTRRARVVAAALASAPVDFGVGFPERTGAGGYGDHCGLGDEPSFRDWDCAPGLACRPYDAPRGEHVGQCLPAVAASAGDPCEHGPLKPANDPTRDRVASVTREECAANAVCNRNAVGFPGGMCTEDCGALSKSARCGAIAVLEPFNACVARGEPFFDCLTSHARAAGLRACSAAEPCRDDYVCARTATGGACIPPYFLFQLRVDGHP
jgi:hypothetical protein